MNELQAWETIGERYNTDWRKVQNLCDNVYFLGSGKFPSVSPSLTDDQRTVLEWLTENGNPNEPFAALDELTGEVFYTEGFKTCIYVAFNNLTGKQQFQVLAAFAEWGSKGDNQ